jgi:hypothetical protein
MDKCPDTFFIFPHETSNCKAMDEKRRLLMPMDGVKKKAA